MKKTISNFERQQIEDASSNSMVQMLMRILQQRLHLDLHKQKNVQQLKVSAIIKMWDDGLMNVKVF